MKIKIKTGVAWKNFPKGILIEPDIALNGTAAQMFELLAIGQSIEDVKAKMLSEFAVTEEILSGDLNRLIEALIEYNIAEVN